MASIGLMKGLSKASEGLLEQTRLKQYQKREDALRTAQFENRVTLEDMRNQALINQLRERNKHEEMLKNILLEKQRAISDATVKRQKLQSEQAINKAMVDGLWDAHNRRDSGATKKLNEMFGLGLQGVKEKVGGRGSGQLDTELDYVQQLRMLAATLAPKYNPNTGQNESPNMEMYNRVMATLDDQLNRVYGPNKSPVPTATEVNALGQGYMNNLVKGGIDPQTAMILAKQRGFNVTAPPQPMQPAPMPAQSGTKQPVDAGRQKSIDELFSIIQQGNNATK
jgi:hypothetical protein